MSLDTNNTLNKWLTDIYEDCEARTGLKAKAMGIDLDTYAISKQEYNTIHNFCTEGINSLVNRCSMVQYVGQTPIDAINYIQEYDTDLDEDDALGQDQFTQDSKMQQKDIQYMIFDIDGLDKQQERYTTVQRFIRDALVNYILAEWYRLVGMNDVAMQHEMKYDDLAGSINTSSALNSRSITRVPRHF